MTLVQAHPTLEKEVEKGKLNLGAGKYVESDKMVQKQNSWTCSLQHAVYELRPGVKRQDHGAVSL